MNNVKLLILTWLAGTSVLAFFLFGYDKFRSGKSARRVPEFQLLAVAVLGGWLGGLAGMLIFRHKTAKSSFKFKYAIAFLIWPV
ncbi:MAG: DUF1294 domain-containing protein [Verrucomicrobiota bacterium]